MAFVITGDAATNRTNLGLGTAATLDVGSGANNIVQLDGSGNLPALNGSALTGIDAGNVLQTQVLLNSNRFTTPSGSFVGQGQTITVTPISASSTIIIHQGLQSYNGSSGETNYISIDINGVNPVSIEGLYQHYGANNWVSSSFVYSYQPGTTSNQTYEIIMKVSNGTGYWGWSGTTSYNNCRMVIMECEI